MFIFFYDFVLYSSLKCDQIIHIKERLFLSNSVKPLSVTFLIVIIKMLTDVSRLNSERQSLNQIEPFETVYKIGEKEKTWWLRVASPWQVAARVCVRRLIQLPSPALHSSRRPMVLRPRGGSTHSSASLRAKRLIF